MHIDVNADVSHIVISNKARAIESMLPHWAHGILGTSYVVVYVCMYVEFMLQHVLLALASCGNFNRVNYRQWTIDACGIVGGPSHRFAETCLVFNCKSANGKLVMVRLKVRGRGIEIERVGSIRCITV